MPLNERQAVTRANELMGLRTAESERLELIHDYVRDDKNWRAPFLPAATPVEIQRLAQIARFNMMRFVVRAASQMLYVEGHRAPRQADNSPAWRLWQSNQMDARQIGIHKGALTYGKAYATVLPGEGRSAVFRGVSPRRMTVAYDEDDVWPEFAIERRSTGWWLYDKEARYFLNEEKDQTKLTLGPVEKHDAGVCPVVRFRETDDLDDPVTGLVEPLIPLQDQINVTTFDLLVAQHYGAHGQKWIKGWLAESDLQKVKASASKFLTFEDKPEDIEIGEFSQTKPDGYLASRDASLRGLATVSQTSAHELLGQLINLSAEALAAAEASAQRAAGEYQTVVGEGHEQMLWLGAKLAGETPDLDAEVRWRNTESRALGMLVDALGKAAAMLNIPRRAMWEPFADAIGASQTQIDQWETLREEERAEEALNQRLGQAMNQRPAQPAPGQRLAGQL